MKDFWIGDNEKSSVVARHIGSNESKESKPLTGSFPFSTNIFSFSCNLTSDSLQQLSMITNRASITIPP